MASTISGASLENIYNRMAETPTYHPLDANTFSDWSLEAGDVITVTRGNKAYQSPIHNTRMTWKGAPQITISSKGNKEREAVSKVSRRKFGGGGAGVRDEEKLYREFTSSDGKLWSAIYMSESVLTVQFENEIEQVNSTIQQTAGEIYAAVYSSNSQIYSYVDMTATYIQQEVASVESSLGSAITQTASAIRAEVYASNSQLYSYVNATATNIQQSVNNALSGVGSMIEQSAEEIRAEVYAADSQLYSYVNATATNIQQSVNSAISDIGSSIEQTATEIRSEVHAADSQLYSYVNATATNIQQSVNNALSGVGSMIEQSANEIRAEVYAADSQLYSYVNATATNIQQSVNSAISDIGSSIDQTASEIRAEVHAADSQLYSYVNATATNIQQSVNSSISGIGSTIEQTAREIRAEVHAADSQLYIYVNATATNIQQSVNNEIDDLGSTITQTASAIRAEVHAADSQLYSYINATATSIQQSVNNAISDLGSSIEETASEIRAEVHASDSQLYSYVNATATNIQQSVNNALSGVGSMIEQSANEIRAEVYAADSQLYSYVNATATNIQQSVNNALSGVGSMIEQSAEEIRAEVYAADSQLYSYVNATATNIQQSVNSAISDVGSSIEQTATEIRSEVHASDSQLYSYVNQTATSIQQTINSTASSLGSSITQTANSIRTEVHAADSQLYSYVNATATRIQQSVNSTASSLGSSITQTANAIRAETHAADSQLYSYVNATATRIQQSVVSTASSLQSSIDQQADKIGLVVTGTGAGAHIDAASIVAAINQGASSVVIHADHIELDGDTVAASLTSEDITVGHIDADSITVDNGITAADIDAPIGTIDDINILSINNFAIGNFIRAASVNEQTNTLTLYPVTGSPINFSKAASFDALTGSWGGIRLVVTTDPSSDLEYTVGFPATGNVYDQNLYVSWYDVASSSSSGTNITIPYKVTANGSGSSGSIVKIGDITAENVLDDTYATAVTAITANGTYAPAQGKVGFSQVVVDVDNSQPYQDGFNAGYDDARRKITYPSTGTGGQFLLSVPNETRDGQDTKTFVISKDPTPGSTGYVSVVLSSVGIVGRVSIGDWYDTGWNAGYDDAKGKVTLPSVASSGEKQEFTLLIPNAARTGQDTRTFRMNKGTPGSSGYASVTLVGVGVVGRIDISDWYTSGVSDGGAAAGVSGSWEDNVLTVSKVTSSATKSVTYTVTSVANISYNPETHTYTATSTTSSGGRQRDFDSVESGTQAYTAGVTDGGTAAGVVGSWSGTQLTVSRDLNNSSKTLTYNVSAGASISYDPSSHTYTATGVANVNQSQKASATATSGVEAFNAGYDDARGRISYPSTGTSSQFTLSVPNATRDGQDTKTFALSKTTTPSSTGYVTVALSGVGNVGRISIGDWYTAGGTDAGVSGAWEDNVLTVSRVASSTTKSVTYTVTAVANISYNSETHKYTATSTASVGGSQRSSATAVSGTQAYDAGVTAGGTGAGVSGSWEDNVLTVSRVTSGATKSVTYTVTATAGITYDSTTHKYTATGGASAGGRERSSATAVSGTQAYDAGVTDGGTAAGVAGTWDGAQLTVSRELSSSSKTLTYNVSAGASIAYNSTTHTYTATGVANVNQSQKASATATSGVEAFNAGYDDARGKITYPSTGTSSSFTLSVPNATRDGKDTKTFALSKTTTPSSTGYVTVALSGVGNVGRISIGDWYTAGVTAGQDDAGVSGSWEDNVLTVSKVASSATKSVTYTVTAVANISYNSTTHKYTATSTASAGGTQRSSATAVSGTQAYDAGVTDGGVAAGVSASWDENVLTVSRVTSGTSKSVTYTVTATAGITYDSTTHKYTATGAASMGGTQRSSATAVSGTQAYDAGVTAGWNDGYDNALGKITYPASGTSASFTLKVPNAARTGQDTKTFTISKTTTPASSGYASVSLGSVVVGRVAIGDWYTSGWNAGYDDARGRISYPSTGTSSQFTLSVPNATRDGQDTKTFALSKTTTPSSTGYVTVALSGVGNVGRISIGDWYTAGVTAGGTAAGVSGTWEDNVLTVSRVENSTTKSVTYTVTAVANISYNSETHKYTATSTASVGGSQRSSATAVSGTQAYDAGYAAGQSSSAPTGWDLVLQSGTDYIYHAKVAYGGQTYESWDMSAKGAYDNGARYGLTHVSITGYDMVYQSGTNYGYKVKVQLKGVYEGTTLFENWYTSGWVLNATNAYNNGWSGSYGEIAIATNPANTTLLNPGESVVVKAQGKSSSDAGLSDVATLTISAADVSVSDWALTFQTGTDYKYKASVKINGTTYTSGQLDAGSAYSNGYTAGYTVTDIGVSYVGTSDNSKRYTKTSGSGSSASCSMQVKMSCHGYEETDTWTAPVTNAYRDGYSAGASSVSTRPSAPSMSNTSNGGTNVGTGTMTSSSYCYCNFTVNGNKYYYMIYGKI